MEMVEKNKMEMNLCNKISIKLALRNMRKSQGKQKNIVSSPMSINILLNILAVGFEDGSSGQTELMNALGFKSVDEINQVSSEFMMSRTNIDAGPTSEPGSDALKRKRGSDDLTSMNIKDGPTLAITNAVITDPAHPFKARFVEVATQFYQSYTGTLDFAKKSGVVKEVNSWSEKQTNGLIKCLISEYSLGNKTALILVNALYFKGHWATKFKKSDTEPENFHLLDGTTIQVPFMKSTGSQYYRSFDDFKLLKLPYKSGEDTRKNFSMYFFVPEMKTGLKRLLRKFKSDPSLIHTKCESKTYCITWIPKFKVLYDFEPSDILKRMGLDLSKMGELTNMVDKPKGDPEQVSKVIQKSYIEVMEEGTEAAAVTYAIYAQYRCCETLNRAPRVVRFIADRPFFFMIKDDVSGVVLFSGIARMHDRSDEEMFEIFGNSISRNILSSNTSVFACTVGQKPSKAKYYLDDSTDVINMLMSLAEASHSISSPISEASSI